MPGLFHVAASAVILRGETVLLLLRGPDAAHAPETWDTPNGRLESGESVLGGLRREIAEETGLTSVEILRPVGTWRAFRKAERQEMIGIAHLCRHRGGEVRLSAEHTAYRWVPFAEVGGLAIEPGFREALLAAIQAGVQAMLKITQEAPNQAEILELLRQSEAYSAALYPPESIHMLNLEQLMQPHVRFFVARQDGKAVGCGALVLGQGGQAEIKRMFVTDAARGTGVGRAVLEAIEHNAAPAGVTLLQLETGVSNREALSLYRRFGYRQRGPFGAYPTDDPTSIFMEKRLT